jgi:AraC family transcriptional regulator
MPKQESMVVDFSQEEATSTILPCAPILSSHQLGWKSIYLEHYRLPACEIPEIFSPQHALIIPACEQSSVVEMFVDNRFYLAQLSKGQVGCIGIIPAHLPIRSMWLNENEFTQCYLEPALIDRVAYESVNPDRVELMLAIPPTIDPLIWQISSSLKTVLASGDRHSCFYAESMATALAVHLLKYYATRRHVLRKDRDGLTKIKLNQAIEYINEHLSEDLSLMDIATELEMSQYYFCRSFKQSIGVTPHAYLVQRRIERAQALLSQKQGSILDIAIECGFANSSSFAKCFRRQTGVSPQQFRSMSQE